MCSFAKNSDSIGISQIQFRCSRDCDALRHPEQLIEYHPVRSPLRQGSYRGLFVNANYFARESHMDDFHAARRWTHSIFGSRIFRIPNCAMCFRLRTHSDGLERRSSSGQGFGLGGRREGCYVRHVQKLQLMMCGASRRARGRCIQMR